MSDRHRANCACEYCREARETRGPEDIRLTVPTSQYNNVFERGYQLHKTGKALLKEIRTYDYVVGNLAKQLSPFMRALSQWEKLQ